MMQAIPLRRPTAERPPPELDVVEMVWVCETEKISAPDKRAYEFLFAETQGGRLRILTTSLAVGRNQGTSGDAGRARLKNLASVGLIEYKPAQKRGSYEVWLLEPFSALRALGSADPQLDLPFENTSWEGPSESQAGQPDDANFSQDGILESQVRQIGPHLAEEPRRGTSLNEDPPEEPREVPPFEVPRRPSGLLEKDCAPNRQSTIRRPSELSVKTGLPVALAGEESRRGSSGGTSPAGNFGGEPPPDPVADLARRRAELGIRIADVRQPDQLDVTRVAAIAAAVAKQVPSEEEQGRKREHWIHRILTRVGDPELKTCVAVKVACAIVRGELEADVVEEILANLAAHQRNKTLTGGSPGKYFLFSARGAFEERGLTWLAYHKPKPR